MKQESVETIEYVKLLKPNFTKTIGQGEPPKGINISINGNNYFLEYGQVFKLSATCDTKNKIADLSTKPYALINTEFYEQQKNQFEIINNKKEKE